MAMQALLERFSVRKSETEKAAFRDALMEEMESMGYEPRIEESGILKAKNLVVGDPDKAVIVFCARYDTPARRFVPSVLFPANPVLDFLMQILNMILLLVPSLVLYVLLWQILGHTAVLLFFLVYLALLMLDAVGFPNRSNRNQSSGLQVLLRMLESWNGQVPEKAAVVLLDRGEVFHLGARGFAKAHPEVQFTKLVLDVSSVGLGNHLLLSPRKGAAKCTGYRTLMRYLEHVEGCDFRALHAPGLLGVGDDRPFFCGMQLMACEKGPLGLWIRHLHTPKDTEADEQQIHAIARALCALAHCLSGGKAGSEDA